MRFLAVVIFFTGALFGASVVAWWVGGELVEIQGLVRELQRLRG